jgi:hypothetical protein
MEVFAQGFEEQFAVGIAMENVFAPIAAAHNVINGSLVLQTKLAGHDADAKRRVSFGQQHCDGLPEDRL